MVVIQEGSFVSLSRSGFELNEIWHRQLCELDERSRGHQRRYNSTPSPENAAHLAQSLTHGGDHAGAIKVLQHHNDELTQDHKDLLHTATHRRIQQLSDKHDRDGSVSNKELGEVSDLYHSLPRHQLTPKLHPSRAGWYGKMGRRMDIVAAHGETGSPEYCATTHRIEHRETDEHRHDGPAVERRTWNERGLKHRRVWRHGNRTHREDGPARESLDYGPDGRLKRHQTEHLTNNDHKDGPSLVTRYYDKSGKLKTRNTQHYVNGEEAELDREEF